MSSGASQPMNRLAQRAQVVDADPSSVPAPTTDPWRLIQRRRDPQHDARDETLFALANGALGVRGGFEESPSPTQGSFLAGVWERAPIHHHERHHGFALNTDTRVPVADATAIRIRIGDTAVDPAQGEILAFERSLDFRQGRLSRSLRWRSARGDTFAITAERIVPIAHPGLLCIRFHLRSLDYSGPIALESSIAGDRQAAAQGDDPRFGAGTGLDMSTSHTAADETGAWLAQHTRASAIGVVCTQRHRAHGVKFVDASTDTHSALQTYAGEIRAGGEITLEKFVAYAWTQPGSTGSAEDLHAAACATLDAAITVGFDKLAQAQAGEFAAFWRNAAISISGRDADQGNADEQALHFSLFHIFQSVGRDGRNGIAAKGLTGEGYEGHAFWDSETFVLPALAFTAPELMRPSLIWRFRALDRARAHAREMGHARGALYPWRTIEGDECSAHYPSGSAQYHINAAVAFAIKLYVEASDDHAFLAGVGVEMLIETARIWLQVGHFNARRGGAFCIDSVTGPDEYTALIDNNYYTNRMAQEHLRYTLAATRELESTAPAVYTALAAKLAFDKSELADFARAADAMYLPFDAKLGIVAQDDTFLDKPVWDFAGTPPEKYPLLMHHHPLTLYRYQVCKQADALLALVLAGDNLDRAAKRRSFDYYEKITVHDSTLSASTFAILAAEVGHADQALRFFHETLRVDLDDLHANASHGAHMAAMGGSWLAFAWGFGGLRVHAGRLGFDPMLPSAWRDYRFCIGWKGRRLTITVDAQAAHYLLAEGEPLDMAHAGERLTLVCGTAQTRALTDHASAFPGQFKALIFDLDGVIADTAHLHQAAWNRLAGELGLPWDDGIGEKLKGVDRAASLEIVLGAAASKYTNAQKQELADRKNGYYRAAIATFSADDLLPGAHAALLAARAAGLKIALASASRSAGELVERLGVAQLFDYVVDSATITRAKPDPEIFQRAAAALGVDPAACIGIEDAQAGVAAIKAAGMTALGIGDARILHEADAVLPDLRQFNLKDFVVLQ